MNQSITGTAMSENTVIQSINNLIHQSIQSMKADDSSSTGEAPEEEGHGLSAGMIVWAVMCFLLTLAFTTYLVKKYKRPSTPYAISGIVWISWLCVFVIVFLVPLDLVGGTGLEPIWATVFWIGFVCTWCLLPMVQEYYDNGGFTPKHKLLLACRQNGILVCVALTVVIAMSIYLWISQDQGMDAIATTFKTLSNAIGLLLLILLAGYGLVEFPRMLYHSSHRSRRRDLVYYQAANTFHEASDTRDQFCELLKCVANVERKLINQHDRVLIGYIEEIKATMADKDAELKGSNYRPSKSVSDLTTKMEAKQRYDYRDLIRLNHAVRKNVRHLWLVDQLWGDTLSEAFQLEAELADVAGEAADVTDLESGSSLSRLTGCLHVSGSHMSSYRRTHFPRFLFVMSILCGLTSILLLWAELSIPIKAWGGTDVNPFTHLVNGMAPVPVIQQIFTILLLAYLMLCAVYPLFKVRISSMYYMGVGHSDTNSLVYNATVMLRVSIALAYNFTLFLSIQKAGLGALLENITDVPFLGNSFNDIFPVFMIIFSISVALNLIGRAMALCNIERFHFIASSAGGSKNMSDSQVEARGVIHEGKQLVKGEKRKRDAAIAAGERFEFHASMNGGGVSSPTNGSINQSVSPTHQPLASPKEGGLSGYKGRIIDKKAIRGGKKSNNSLDQGLMSGEMQEMSSDGPAPSTSRFGKWRN